MDRIVLELTRKQNRNFLEGPRLNDLIVRAQFGNDLPLNGDRVRKCATLRFPCLWSCIRPHSSLLCTQSYTTHCLQLCPHFSPHSFTGNANIIWRVNEQHIYSSTRSHLPGGGGWAFRTLSSAQTAQHPTLLWFCVLPVSCLAWRWRRYILLKVYSLSLDYTAIDPRVCRIPTAVRSWNPKTTNIHVI